MKRKLFFSIALSALFLWWALKGLDFHEIAGAFRDVSWWPVAWMPLTLVATHTFRARRWKVIVNPLKKIDLWEMFKINAVGFMAINIFPLRLGEFTRPLLLKSRHGIAFTTGLATIAVERVFDLVTITLVLVLGLLSAPIADQQIPLLGVGMKTMAVSALSIVVPLVAFLILTVVARARALALVEKVSRIFPAKLGKHIHEIAENLMAGFEALPSIGTVIRLFFESIGVWGSVVISYFLAFEAFHLNLHWSAGFSVLGITAVGIGLPAAPGFVGTLQVFIQAGLALYGVDKAMGFAYSIVIHATNFLYSVLAGLLFIPSMSVGVGKLYDEASHQT